MLKMETRQFGNWFGIVSVLETALPEHVDKSNLWRFHVFGNKKNKKNRLQKIVSLVTQADGITEAELARKLGVTPGTVNKDMGIVEKKTGSMFWQDDENRIYRFDDDDNEEGGRRA